MRRIVGDWSNWIANFKSGGYLTRESGVSASLSPTRTRCITIHESAKFARMLRNVGKVPTIMEVEGAPHIIMNLGGVEKSRELLWGLIAYIANRCREPLKGALP
jgi:hypothetical protein